MRSQLVEADRLLVRKNQEIQAMGGVLAEANRKISDRDDEIQQLESKIQNLESQLAERDAEIAAIDSEDIDPIELANKLNALLGKGRPPKTQLSVKELRKALSEVKPKQNPDTMPGEQNRGI